MERLKHNLPTEVPDVMSGEPNVGGPDVRLLGWIVIAQEAADVRISAYNEDQPHESLGDVPPAVFLP